MGKNYQDLRIWQKAMDNVVLIYKITELFPKHELFGLVAQIRRAAVSIPANIAEGYVRKGQELKHFLSMALGSSAELETHILLAQKLGYISKEAATETIDKIQHAGKMITNFYKTI